MALNRQNSEPLSKLEGRVMGQMQPPGSIGNIGIKLRVEERRAIRHVDEDVHGWKIQPKVLPHSHPCDLMPQEPWPIENIEQDAGCQEPRLEGAPGLAVQLLDPKIDEEHDKSLSVSGGQRDDRAQAKAIAARYIVSQGHASLPRL